MNLAAYQQYGQIAYKALANVVAHQIEGALNNQDPPLRRLPIQQRAKSNTSLARKLKKIGAIDSNDIEKQVKDLAGCRIIFYTNSAVQAFLNSRIIPDLFEIDWDRTKIHHPVPGQSEPSELFISNNYVVRIRPDLITRDTEAFKEMWCEIQVQTALNHAWSEMAHDTIYIRPSLEQFASAKMEDIEKRMQRIMREHLLPAGYEFQKVAEDFERLSSGKALFDRDPLALIQQCKDNNERHDLLKKFETYVLPHFDDLPSVHTEIRSAVAGAVEDALKTPTLPIETPFGQLPGHSGGDILKIGIEDILARIKHLNEESVAESLDAACRLFPLCGGDTDRKILMEFAKRLARPNLTIWQQAGPIVQQVLVDAIERMDAVNRSSALPLVLEVLDQVLQPELEGISSNYQSITISTAPIVAREDVVRIRSKAIDLLFQVFLSAQSQDERSKVKSHLSTAMRVPIRGNHSNAVLAMILRDSTRIVDFYTHSIDKIDFEIREEVEERILWLYRNNRTYPESIANDPEVARAQAALLAAIQEFRGKVNGDSDFVRYKTLVGFQSVFQPDWEDDGFAIEGHERHRNQLISNLVDIADSEPRTSFLKFLERCAQTRSNDLATFPSFARFFQELGRRQPALVISYLDTLNDDLAGFLPSMLTGLESSEMGSTVILKVKAWINEKRYLAQIIRFEQFSERADKEILVTALQAAIEKNDQTAVILAVSTSYVRHADVPGGLIKDAFLPAVRYLRQQDNLAWKNQLWPRSEQAKFFSDLEPYEVDELLEYLIPVQEIDFREESLLAALTARSREKLIRYLFARLELERQGEHGEGYDAIPYRFYELHKVLAEAISEVVATARAMDVENKSLFQYREARLIAIACPTFSNALGEALLAVADQRGRADFEFVTSVLRNYKGETSLHGIAKHLIGLLPEGDELLNEISVALDETGVVSGEFGFVEAYKAKREEILPWLQDERPKVRAFADRHIRQLDRMIAAEQRRSEEDLEMNRPGIPGDSIF